MSRIEDSSRFRRGQPVTIVVDGERVPAYRGKTIAGALLATGHRAWRRTRHGQPRGLFCGIGVCFDCTVTVNGTTNVRACLTPIADGMIVETGIPMEHQP